MSDIHILTGSQGFTKRHVNKTYAFHFPIDVGDQVADAAQDPDLVAFVSAVPDMATNYATELQDIKDGKVVEKVVTVPYLRTQPDANIATKVRAEYNGMSNEVEIGYIEKYRQYLNTLTA